MEISDVVKAKELANGRYRHLTASQHIAGAIDLDGNTYKAKNSCQLVVKSFNSLPYGAVTKADVLLIDKTGVTLSAFTVKLM